VRNKERQRRRRSLRARSAWGSSRDASTAGLRATR